MNHALFKLILLCFMVCCSMDSKSNSTEFDLQVDVFQDTKHRVAVEGLNTHSIQLSVFELGQVNQIEAYLSQGLKDNSVESQNRVKDRITPELKEQLSSAWQAHIFAADLGINYLPAIVINRQYVFYGSNVNQAIELWRSY